MMNYLCCLVFVLFFVVIVPKTINGAISEEDDGFRRLLRRASAEADRPLLRQQRRNRDDDDEDSFEASHESVVRKKREEEDNFYHTLLKRAESKRHEKRSFDTDDVDNKDAFGLREDWTGDSKISDADKSELENLFSKLNTRDEEKKDVTRSIEEETVNQAASDYASWLLEQPRAKLSGAINRKLDVDHSLTKLLFEDKRDVSVAEKKHIKKSKKVTGRAGRKAEITKTNTTSSALNANATTPESLANTTTTTNSVPEASASAVDVKNTTSLNNKTSIGENVQNTNTPLNETSKLEGVSGSARLNESVVDSLEGGQLQRDETPAPLNTTTSVLNAENTTAAADAVDDVKTNVENATVSTQSPCQASCSPKLVAVDNPCTCQELANVTANSGNSASGITIAGPKLCTDDSPQCLCTRACYPKLIATLSPCSCEGEEKQKNQTAAAPNAPAFPQVSICTDKLPECLCKRFCHPHPVARLTPCACHALTKSKDIENQNQQQPEQPVQQQQDQQVDARPKSISASLVTQEVPDAPKDPNTVQASLLTNSTTNVQNATAPAAHGPDVYARGWCQTACHPYIVAFENPCKCAKAISEEPVAKSFPPRAPGVVGYPGYPAAAAQVPAAAYANPQQAYAAAVPYQAQAQMVAPAYQYPVSAVQGVDSNPEVRTSVKSRDGTCQRSCFPHAMLTQTPCLCSNQTGIKVDKEKPQKKNGEEAIMKKIYTDTAYYQGCFKDMRPLRDLPKRFTRYATTPETCVRECAYQNYKFAGVQYGYLCFCGNGFGRYGSLPDNDCNSDCHGDSHRKCGGYFHNSVYSVDGKEYDPSDFNFAKVDEDEKKRDALVEAQQPPMYDATNPAYAGMTPFANNYPGQMMAGNVEHQDKQGDNVATHLVKAAQAALTAAKKLLPSVSKKHKIATKGKKVKREDDEEDAAIMQQKMSALSSLGAVHDILKKTAFISETRDAEREKRSIDEDSDPYDPEDGKDLLTAYMANVDLYKRQTRSVDEDEEEDEGNEKARFEYRRMTLGETDEGEFVEKYNDVTSAKNKKKDQKKKRNALDFVTYKHIKRSAEEDAVKTKIKIVVSPIPQKQEIVKSLSRKRRSLLPVGEIVKERSIVEGSGADLRKKRSPLSSVNDSHSRRRRSVEGSDAFVSKTKRDLKKREFSMADLPAGAVKMAARSGDVNDIEASLRALEFLAKRDEVPKENDADGSDNDSAESGDSEDSDSGSGSGGFEDGDDEIDKLFEKRSVDEDNVPTTNKMRSDVDKGVDNLLNLVVELYKQQKTIRAFESSVRSLRDDIMGELKVPSNKKQYASKKVREEIERTAKQRLHVLTSSIENKIKQFSKTHPEASKQVNLATSLLPQLPLTDEKYKIAKREITRRAAEFDNLEDAQLFNQDAAIPDILKEHFRRNAEDDVEFDESRKQQTVNGELTLPRMHRDVQESQMEVGEEDYDVLFH